MSAIVSIGRHYATKNASSLSGSSTRFVVSKRTLRCPPPPPPPPSTRKLLKSPSSLSAARTTTMTAHKTATRSRSTLRVATNSTKRRKATTLSAEAAMAQGRLPPPRQTVWESLEEVLRRPRTMPIPRWISPEQSTFTLSEVFGHASFVLVGMAYAVDDFMMLRMIAVAGSSAMLVFTYYHPHGRVLWLPFKWNCLFIGINLYRIGKVHLNRYYAERLSPELLELRRKNFYHMDPADFARLVKLGTLQDLNKGDVVINQGEKNSTVGLVVSGELHVLRDGKLAYLLEEANFMSEFGLHAGLLLQGEVESCCTVVASTEHVRLLVWDRTELVDLMEQFPNIRSWIKTTLSWDIVRKLKAQRKLLRSGLIDDPAEWTLRRNQQTQHRYASILHNILTQHVNYLQEGRKELNKYREIHHIDDEHHNEALARVGWTHEEFEAGRKLTVQDPAEEDPYSLPRHDWRWYLQTAVLRVFG